VITTAKILKYDALGNKLVIAPRELIDREIANKQISDIEIRLDDGRTISAEQRRKIFALVKEIALWSGNEPEYIRSYLTWDFCCGYGCEVFSLSNVDMTTAKDFITYLIEFCLKWDVPTKEALYERTEDIDKYLYACLYNKKCAVCNRLAEVHHVDHVGMGYNRHKICHIGMRAEALCRLHHKEAHNKGQIEFDKKYHIYGIKLDKKLCDVYELKSE
jgi:hypothetical protein